MSERVVVSAELCGKLAAANGNKIVLCDDSGRVVGYAFTPTQTAALEADHRTFQTRTSHLYPAEEIARLEAARRNDPRPDVPHEEVLRWVEAQ